MQLLRTFYPELNLLSYERPDPLIELLLQSFRLGDNRYCYVAGQLLIAGIGAAVLTRMTSHCSWRMSSMSGVLFALLLLFALGPDPLLLTVHWFPLLVASAIAARRGGLLGAVLFLAAGTLYIATSGALAFVGVLVAAGFVQLSSSGDPLVATGNRLNFLLVFLALVALSLFFLPGNPMASYPPEARVVTISPLTTQGATLFGPVLEPNPIVYSAYVRELDGHYSRARTIALLLIAAVVIGSLRRKEAVIGIGTLLVMIALLFAERWIASPYRELLPFDTARRIIPGVALVPLPWTLLPFCFVWAMLWIARELKESSLVLLTVATVLLVIADLGFNTDRKLIRRVQVPHTQVVGNVDNSIAALRVTDSPSNYLIHQVGEWAGAPDAVSRWSKGTFQPIVFGQDVSVTVGAQPSNELAPAIVDGNNLTRWQTRRPQTPGDYILVEFDRRIRVSKAELSLFDVYTDFPRGLRVEGSVDGVQFETISDYPNWNGAVRWTEDGLPYFAPQSDVEVILPNEPEVKALKFIQTGNDPIFDWSMAELRLFQLK